ncbi:MAG: 7-cyano-7-deazaguanine synthase [Candidatus Hermodarchaeota archaeon]
MTQNFIIAITGANGYLGTNTIKAAKKLGWTVNAIVRREEAVEIVNPLGAIPYLVKDFDVPQLQNAFKGCRAVIHFANIVCGSKDQFEQVNIDGLRNIIIAAKNSRVSRIIYPSGLGVNKYGKTEWANNNYFYSKRKAEELLIESNLPYVIFRPSYILGPNDELIPELIEQIYDGIVYIAGDGTVPIQPIFIEDATSAFLSAAKGEGKDNALYNLVGPETTNMLEILENVLRIIKEMGLNLPNPKLQHISYEEAPKILDICEEMVDVMKCDILEDGSITAKALNYTLSPLNFALKAAVFEKLMIKTDIKENSAIVLLSGGIDSTTALFWALQQEYEVIGLTINYKWRPKKEMDAIKKFVELTKIKLIEIDLPFVMVATDLRLEGYPIPSVENAPEGYIPLRNLLFYSIAAYFAELYGIKTIIGGHIKEDFEKFRDATPTFFQSLQDIIIRSIPNQSKRSIEFLFPLINLNKVEVIKMAKELNVPLDLTWSCYGDFENPCGICTPCQSRADAIKKVKKTNG